ncbi:unnamed protein product [Sphenostylis stenocarpa]|uniref:Glycosyltransferase N-terminal domain-containing protein n=1 Tax=Sphenostylis stenocarpa TaxID=92480 RepID=A0AA86V966_9FABA|nr:unnamed protein product [Sphenostylis stenocarpa]
MGIPHFLLIPYPTVGHVNPLMQLSQVLAMHGCKITFLNTEFNHKRANVAGAGLDNPKGTQIRFVTLPDGLGPEDDRKDHKKVIFSIERHMHAMLPKLIQDINALHVNNKITCIVVTVNMGWALEVGHKLGIKGALLWPASATSLATCDCIPKLIDDGIIDSDGNPIKRQEIQLYPNMPMMDPENFPWCGLDKIVIHHIAQEMQTLKLGDWWLCNTAYDLEPAAFSISPRFLPIGPLMATNSNKSSLWQEDITCLDWLDHQPPQSVIYVAFGSSGVIDHNQFKELALGLDFLNKPFLWVVNPSSGNKVNSAYSDEFHGSKGRIVKWAPQKEILNHPSIACFISHCGWNSSIEGVGLRLDKDENGLVSKEEIRKKVEQLFGDEGIKARSLKLKELTLKSIEEGGHSSKNLKSFISWAE